MSYILRNPSECDQGLYIVSTLNSEEAWNSHICMGISFLYLHLLYMLVYFDFFLIIDTFLLTEASCVAAALAVPSLLNEQVENLISFGEDVVSLKIHHISTGGFNYSCWKL